MKKNVAVPVICVLTVLAIVLGILNFTNSASKQKEISNLTAEVSDKMGQIEALNADVTAKVKEIETLNADVADRDGQIESLNADVAGKDEQIKKLNADAADKDNQIKALNADVADRDGQIESLNATVVEKDGQIESLNAAVAEKDSRIKKLDADAAEKANQIKALNADVADRDSRIEALTADAAIRAGQIEALTADVYDKAGQIEILNADAADKSEQITALYTAAAENEKELEALRLDNEMKDGQIRALTTETEAKDRMVTNLREIIGEKDKAIEILQSGLTPEAAPVRVLPQEGTENKPEEEKPEDRKESVREDVKTLVSDLKEAAGIIKEDVRETAKDVKAAVGEKVEEKKDGLMAAIREKAEGIKQAAKEVKEAVEEKVEGVKKTVGALKSAASFDLQVQPFALKEKITLNKDKLAMVAGMLLGGDAEKMALLNQIIDLVNSAEYTVLYDGTNAEAFISAKGEDLASVLMRGDENGLKLYSDLTPGYCFVINGADLAGMMPGKKADMSKIKLAGAFVGPLMKLVSGIRLGEEEAVNETLLETEFTSRTPVNMSLKEIALLGLNTVREVIGNEEIGGMLSGLKEKGLNLSVDQIDEAIRSVEATGDEEMPVLDAGMYKNENNDMVFKVEVTQDGKIVSRSVGGKVGDNGVSEVQIGNKVYVSFKAGKDGVNILIRVKGMEFAIDVVPEQRENGTAYIASVSFLNMEILKIELEIQKDVTLTGKLDTEGKKEITIRDFRQNKELAEEIAKDFLTNYKPVLDEKLQKVAPELMPVFSGLEKIIGNMTQKIPLGMIPGQ